MPKLEVDHIVLAVPKLPHHINFVDSNQNASHLEISLTTNRETEY